MNTTIKKCLRSANFWGTIIFIITVILLSRCTTGHANAISKETKNYVDSIKKNTMDQHDSIQNIVLQAYIHLEDINNINLKSENKITDIHTYFQQKDSLYITLFSMISKLTNSHLDNVIADARQDYNNQITNLNNWISIWVAVLCGISIIVTLILGNLFKEEYSQKITELEKKLSDEKVTKCTFNVTSALECIRNLKEVSKGMFAKDHRDSLIDLLGILSKSNDLFAQEIKKIGINNEIITKEIVRIYIIRYQMFLVEFQMLFNMSYSLVGLSFLVILNKHLKGILDKDWDSYHPKELASDIVKIGEYLTLLKGVLQAQYSEISSDTQTNS